MGKKISESVLDVCEDSKTLINQLDRASIFAKYSETWSYTIGICTGNENMATYCFDAVSSYEIRIRTKYYKWLIKMYYLRSGRAGMHFRDNKSQNWIN